MSVSVIRGTCPHGKVLFAAVNDPNILRPYAKQITEMLSAGFTMERSESPVKLGGDCSECNELRASKSNYGQKEMFG